MEELRPLAAKCAGMLDESVSEDDFRVRCAALGLDPDEAFAPYGEFVALLRGYDLFSRDGLSVPEFGLEDWWAFEKTEGANKPDPWCNGWVRLRG